MQFMWLALHKIEKDIVYVTNITQDRYVETFYVTNITHDRYVDTVYLTSITQDEWLWLCNQSFCD